MEWIAIVLFIVVIAFTLALKSGGNRIGYRTNGPLFSKAERSFYGVLNQAISDEQVLMGKVRVADILSPEKGLNKSNWQTAFNKIAYKHFDYILCEKSTLNVLAAIELDDKSHQSKRSISRDTFLNEACKSAGFKLIRFPAQKAYQISEVKKQIELAFVEANGESA